LGRTCRGGATLLDRQFRSAKGSFDYLVGRASSTVSGMKAECVSGFEVDHQLVRQVDRFLALKDSINVGGRLPKWVEINFL
jgi:hypothetical protein